MPVVSARGLAKTFGAHTVLHDVQVTIRRGSRVGVVGPNGAGKSTLASILGGQLEADDGVVEYRRGARVRYLAQDPKLTPGLTATEAVLQSLDDWSAARKRYEDATARIEATDNPSDALILEQSSAADEVERLGGWDRAHEVSAILEQLGLTNPDALVETLSGGQRRAVALTAVLVAEPDILILDEPTNHLDIRAIEWLEEHLKRRHRGAVLLVTHDRTLLDRVAEHTWEVRDGVVTEYEGGYDAYLNARAEREEMAERTEANRRNFLRQELEWRRRQPKARSGKQKARLRRIDDAVADAPKTRTDQAVRLETAAPRSGKVLVELRKLTLEMEGQTLVKDLQLSVQPGERIGIVGPNGCGKTTLLRALTGETDADDGSVWRGKTLEPGYLDQQRSGLDPEESVRTNIAGKRSHITIGDRDIPVPTYLERFLFRGPRSMQPVASLSGGEKARCALAKLLASPANLLLLDEPTNDLDVETLSALESMLVEHPGAVIVVSHDRRLLDRVSDALLVFEGDGRVVRHTGGYTDYKLRMAANKAQEAAAREAQARTKGGGTGKEASASGSAGQTAAEAGGKASGNNSGGKRKLSYKEARELEAVTARIEELDERIAEIEAIFSDPDQMARHTEELGSLGTELESGREESATLMERWEELAAIEEG